MSKKDFYDVLGVSRSASEKDLKSAYRKMAKQYHPDANPGNDKAEAKFKEANEAYDTLKDPQKRAAYDRFGHEGMKAGANSGGGRRGGAGPGAGFNGFSDIFDEFFGQNGAGNPFDRKNGIQKARGEDLRYNIDITLEQAFAGKTVEVNLEKDIRCEPCVGRGSLDPRLVCECSLCGGLGKIGVRRGMFIEEQTCRDCKGAGETFRYPCLTCRGACRVKGTRRLNVNVPPGVSEGLQIRMAKEGAPGYHGGPPGDLFFMIHIKEHDLFESLPDSDLLCSATIPMIQAALGGELEIPTIDGGVSRVKIPTGTQSGDKFRLRGKGMSHLHHVDRRGDLYVVVQVETPTRMSADQKNLLKDFEKHKKCFPKADKFLKKIKKFLP
jgi:molecular chaperone DnaJ